MQAGRARLKRRGLPEVVGDLDCTLQAGDDGAWAAALVRLRTDAAWRRDKEARVALAARRFTEEQYVQSYLALYDSAQRGR